MTQAKRPAGRPIGYTPGRGKRITHTNGQWSWNADLLNKKIMKADHCWTWTGSRGPCANLFGAIKNQRPQMTQANRLIYAEHNPDVVLTDIQVKMTCKNKYCCNPNHMTAEPINRKNKPRAKTPRYLLAISEHRFRDLDPETRLQMKNLAREYAESSGHDIEFEYRWMKLKEQDMLMASFKYKAIIDMMSVRLV